MKTNLIKTAMKSRIFILLLVSMILATACKKDKEEEDTLYRISGYLLSDGEPMGNAQVNIDQLEQYKTTTNDEGYFSITDVSPGEHTLNAVKTFEMGYYIQRSFDLDMNNDLQLDELILPNPVAIMGVVMDTVENLVTITWNSSQAEDFREYKLYSHNTTGLDELTGTLEHVSTNRADTVLTLSMPSATTRYFRVFVMNDYGQLGGSNIVRATSSNKNLLSYGDFEDQDMFFQTWNISGNVFIVDSLQKAGSRCLLLMSEIDTINTEWTICRFDHPQLLLEENVAYELSFWYKARGLGHMMYPLYFYYEQDNQRYLETIIGSEWTGSWWNNSPIKILDGVDWTYYSVVFYPAGSAAAKFYFTGNIDELYFDQLQLKKKL
jgi:hypothetical protein